MTANMTITESLSVFDINMPNVPNLSDDENYILDPLSELANLGFDSVFNFGRERRYNIYPWVRHGYSTTGGPFTSVAPYVGRPCYDSGRMLYVTGLFSFAAKRYIEDRVTASFMSVPKVLGSIVEIPIGISVYVYKLIYNDDEYEQLLIAKDAWLEHRIDDAMSIILPVLGADATVYADVLTAYCESLT